MAIRVQPDLKDGKVSRQKGIDAMVGELAKLKDTDCRIVKKAAIVLGAESGRWKIQRLTGPVAR